MEPERGLLLRCGRVFDAQRGALLGPADVLIRGGSVVSVATHVAPRGARVIDARDCTLLAGLIDLDAELVAEPVRGDSGLWLYRAIARAGDLLRRGITTARVLGGADERWSLIDLRRAIADGLAPGCELVVAPHRLDDRRLSTELAAALGRERRNGADWIAVDRRGCERGELRALITGAQDTPVAVSVATGGEARAAIAAGARSVEASCELDVGTVRMAVQRGVYVVPRDGFRARSLDGVKVCLGGRLSGGIDALAQMLGAAEALAAATRTAAQCLALRDRGAISPGSRADLLAVAGDPVADVARVCRPSLVVRHGVVQT